MEPLETRGLTVRAWMTGSEVCHESIQPELPVRSRLIDATEMSRRRRTFDTSRLPSATRRAMVRWETLR